MPIHVLSDIDEVAALYGDDLGHDRTGRIFTSIEWFRNLAHHGFDKSKTPRVYIYTGEGAAERPLCFLFCAADREKRVLSSLTNVYSLDFEPVFSDRCADRRAALGAIFDHIAAERPRWHRLQFERVEAESVAATDLAAAARQAGFRTRSIVTASNYVAAVEPGDFASYRRSLPSRLRNTLARRRRKVQRAHRLETVCLDACSQKALTDYHHVYERSWKASEAFPSFIGHLCETLSRLGILRMGFLLLDDRPVAAQIWIVSAGRAIIYKLAHDEAYKAYSVGSILTEAMLEHAIDRDHAALLDFGTGNEAYKADWMSGRRDYACVEAVRCRTGRGLLRYLRWFASDFRRWIVGRLSGRDHGE